MNYTITGIPNNNILSNLPIELISKIVTDYSGHYRINKKSNKRKLIQQIDPQLKEKFEKIYKPVEHFINLQNILSNNALVSHKIYIFIKDLNENIFVFRDLYNNEVTGELGKYYIIKKYSFSRNNDYNPYASPELNDYKSYTTGIVKTKYGYHEYDLVRKRIIPETYQQTVPSVFG